MPEAENIAESYAKAASDLEYAQDIVQKASKQLENCINVHKVIEAKIGVLVSQTNPIKLLPLLDGRYVLVEHSGYRASIKVITPEKYASQPSEEIWEHT